MLFSDRTKKLGLEEILTNPGLRNGHVHIPYEISKMLGLIPQPIRSSAKATHENKDLMAKAPKQWDDITTNFSWKLQ